MSAATCTHEGARTLYNVERGIAFRADCGDRRVCVAARHRRNREMRERLSLVDRRLSAHSRLVDVHGAHARTGRTH